MEPQPAFAPGYLTEDASAPLMDTCISFLVLETVFMTLLYTSRFVSGDQKANLSMVLLMTSAYLVCICKITVGILSVQIGGAGRHIPALTPSTMTTGLKLNTALMIVCPLTTSLSKLSILCLFYSIFGRTSAPYRIAIRITFALVLIILLVQVIIPFANCKPFSHTWDVFGPGTCAIDGLLLWRYLSIPNVLTTIIMVGIPVPALYRLKISAATKMGLALVFSVCIAGVIAAIMRFQSFLEVDDFHDFTYEQIKPLCWTIAESGIYLIAGVLPTLRPLARKIFGDIPFDKIMSKTFGGSGSSRRWSWRALPAEKATTSGEKGEKTCSDISSKGSVVKMQREER